MKRFIRFCLPMAAVMTLSACAVGPDYKRPEIDEPEKRSISAKESQSLADLPWWNVFKDQVLADLIKTGLDENKDIRIASERVEEAKAQFGFTKADLFPKIDAKASAGTTEPTDKGYALPGEVMGDRSEVYSLSANLSWEIDMFGRLRRATEAQKAVLLSTEDAKKAIMISVVANVASAYFEMRDIDNRLEVAKRTLESRLSSSKLIKTRFEGGVAAKIDYYQAEAEVYRTKTIISDLEKQMRIKENELSFLIGKNPRPIMRGKVLKDQQLVPQIPAGLPSALIERRPDILQSEQELVAANAKIGESKAMLFPRISLTGGYGYVSSDLGELTESPASNWNIAGNLVQPIFEAGKNLRRVEVSEAQQRQALLKYEKTIQQAFREVEDSLVSYQKTGERSQAQTGNVNSNREVLKLAESRYIGGVSSYLEVLDAQRSLFNSELEESQSVRDHLVSLVTLYKSLGGGWQVKADEKKAEETKAVETAPAATEAQEKK